MGAIWAPGGFATVESVNWCIQNNLKSNTGGRVACSSNASLLPLFLVLTVSFIIELTAVSKPKNIISNNKSAKVEMFIHDHKLTAVAHNYPGLL